MPRRKTSPHRQTPAETFARTGQPSLIGVLVALALLVSGSVGLADSYYVTSGSFSGIIPFTISGTTYDWVVMQGGSIGGNVVLDDGTTSGLIEFTQDLSVSSTLSGSGSVLVSSGTTTFTGANTYSGGSTFQPNYATLITGSGSKLVVNGGGSISHASADMSVGNLIDDVAFLTLSGGSVTSRDIFAGYATGATGTILVEGASNLTTTRSLLLGNADGSSGSMNVTGGTVSVGDALEVGVSGNGSLFISGGVVTGSSAYIGHNAGGSGTVTMTGGSWTTIADMLVGDGGTGVLDVLGGTAIVGGDLAAAGGGGTGSVTVGGGGILQSGTGGSGGRVLMDITNDGQVIFNSSGNSSFSNTISGSGSLAKLGSGELTIDASSQTYSGGTTVGAGTLLVTNSGAISHANAAMAVSSGALLDLRGSLTSGDSTVSGTASVNSGGSWTTRDLTVSGSVGVETFGLLTITGTLAKSGSGTVEVKDGSLFIGDGGSTGHLAMNVAVTDPSGIVTFNRSGTDSYSGALSGAGAVRVQGGLALTMSGTNTYTGDTTVDTASSLYVDGALGQTAVYVNAGGLLGGAGSIGGAVAVAETGILSPGTLSQPIGTLTVGSLSMATSGTATGSTVAMRVDGTSSYDQVVGINSGTSTISYAGTLALDFNGTSYATYTVFHLFKDFDPNNVSGQLDGISLSGSSDFDGLTFTFDANQGLWLTGTSSGGQYLEFNQSTGDLVVVPEPSTLLMAAAAVGAMGLAWGKRKRDEALAHTSSTALTTVEG